MQRLLKTLGLALALPIVFANTSIGQTVANVLSFTGTTASENPAHVVLAQGRDGKLYGTTYGLTYGSVFETTTLGGGGDLYAFDNSDGANPIGGVTLGSDGNFYGTAAFGGSTNQGVLFKITPGGTYTILHEFLGGTDGADPFAQPILASDGNLYGTTYGSTVASTVYKYTPSGNFSTIYQFDQTHGGLVASPLIQGTDGNLYGNALDGGANNCGTLFKMSRAGVILSYYSLRCGAGGSLPAGPLVQASDGNFYGVTSAGGAANLGTVFKWTQKGAFTILHQFSGTANGEFPVGLVQATDGNLYGATSSGGSTGDGVLFRMATTGTYSLLYSFQSGVGQSPAAPPFQDTDGTLYGTVNQGGAYGFGGVYSLNVGLHSFITFVRPSGGVGQTAQILGQGLTGTTSVTFNGVAATSFKVLSGTFLTAVVPTGATTGTVVVTTPSGKLNSNKNFLIIGGTASAARGGWPGFPCFPSRSGTVGAPLLRSLQGRVRCCLYHGVCHAQRPASDSRRSSPALYHYLVLPAIAFSAHRPKPRHLAYDSGTDSPALSLRSCRVCCDAGTHPSAHHRTGGGDSVDRDAGFEAADGPSFIAQAQTEEPAPAQSVCRRAEAQSVLAGALLRLQRLDHEEARGEAPVYASQSSGARPGRRTGGVALEQLSFLSLGRSRAGEGE